MGWDIGAILSGHKLFDLVSISAGFFQLANEILWLQILMLVFMVPITIAVVISLAVAFIASIHGLGPRFRFFFLAPAFLNLVAFKSTAHDAARAVYRIHRWFADPCHGVTSALTVWGLREWVSSRYVALAIRALILFLFLFLLVFWIIGCGGCKE